MKIKVSTTPQQKKRILEDIQRQKDSLKSLKEHYESEVRDVHRRIKEIENFWATNEVPIFEMDYDRNVKTSALHEAKAVWKEMGINITTRKMYGCWVCSCCEKPIMQKYIATGHDHTDYSYDVCDCEGVQRNTAWKDLT